VSTDPTTAPAGVYWPRRYLVVGLCFCATFICYIDRVNISVAIIPMAEQMGWDPQTQGGVLSAFFLGYLLTQIAGGRLADRFGGKVVLGAGVLLWSAFTLLTPPSAAAGLAVLLLARVGMGLGEGVTFPSVYSLVARWVPAAERTRAIGLNSSGIPLGTVFALLATPWIVVHFGWPWAFYLFGAAGFLWFVAWQRVAAAGPEQHPSIHESELRAIQADTAAATEAPPPPWSTLLRSAPVWAIVVCHFCNNWAFYVLLSWLPTYLSEGLGVEFESVGMLAMVPSLVSFLFLNLVGWVTDLLIRRGVPTTTVRKGMQTVGFAGSAAALLVVATVTTAPTAILVMSIGMALGAFAMGGFGVNHLDIAPRHAGVLMGLSNTAGTLPGVIGVYASGLILAWTGSWSLVFQVAAGVNIAGLLFYLAFAKAERLFD
jgi:MFS family permease